MHAGDIDIGALRQEDAAEAGAVARRNFAQFGAIIYRRFLFSSQGLAASLLLAGIFCLLLRPTSPLLQAALLCPAFGLHAFYLFARHFYLNANLLHWDLIKVWRYWSLPNSRFLVAKDMARGGRIVGTLGVRRLAGSKATVAELSRLRVEKDYEERGIVSRLNDEAERIAREELNCELIETLTHPDVFPKANELYEKRGYRVTRKAKGGGYYPGLHWEENIFEKEL